MCDEEWRPIPGWEGFYQVSSEGRISGVRRKGAKGGIMKPYKVGDFGHLGIVLQRKGVLERRRINRLVLEAFVGPCPEGMASCHNNGAASDNRLGNLRWDTPSANNYDAVRHGTHGNARKVCCKRGHSLEGDNLIPYFLINYNNRRSCRACDLARRRRYAEQRRAAA